MLRKPVLGRRRGLGLIATTPMVVAMHDGDQTGAGPGHGVPRNGSGEPAAVATSTPPSRTCEQRIEQLRRLGDLRDAGILTEQEFEQEKARLLA